MLGRIESGTYSKNARYPVSAGTKFVQVMLDVPFESSDRARKYAVTKATTQAIEEYRKVHGSFAWDFASISVTHTSFQVLIEFRVEG